MGGEYYEREVYSVQNIVQTTVYEKPHEKQSSSQAIKNKEVKEKTFSQQAFSALNQNSLHKSNDPKRFANENVKLVCKHKNPIVFALDVSASMGDWPMVFSINSIISFSCK